MIFAIESAELHHDHILYVLWQLLVGHGPTPSEDVFQPQEVPLNLLSLLGGLHVEDRLAGVPGS